MPVGTIGNATSLSVPSISFKDVPSKSLKNPKVHSAWCTTHGGALRDLGLRSEAFQLGLKLINCSQKLSALHFTRCFEAWS